MLIHLQSCLIGGGFGGKETRFSPLTTAIAVAANKYIMPVYTCHESIPHFYYAELVGLYE